MAALPRIAAHRGGAALGPENSLAAFTGALGLGIDLLELDVHQSADGEVVVIHDATLDRTTEGTGAVQARLAAALRSLRVRARDGSLTNERVPFLDDVLRLAAGAGADLLVELKGPSFGVRYESLEARVLARLDACGMTERANIMAFNPAIIAAVRALAPGQRTTLLVGRTDLERAKAPATDTPRWAERLGATHLGLEHTLIDEEVVAGARASGLTLGAWTPNDDVALQRLMALGVDIVTTDRPDLALRIRDSR